MGYDQGDGFSHEGLWEAVEERHGSKGLVDWSGTRTFLLGLLAPRLAVCGSCRTQKCTKGKKGRVFILVHTYYKAQPISVRCAGKTSFRRYRYFLALDTSAEWSDPVKRFQHRGMIPVLGPRATRRARKHTGGPGFDPRFGPRLFFCPLRLHYSRDPPMRPRSREVPVSSTPQGQKTDEPRTRPVGTRDPNRSFPNKTAATTSARDRLEKYKTLFLNPQSPRSPHLQSRRPPHNPR